MRPVFVVFLVAMQAAAASAGDWPQWRFDARRSAISPEELPAKLHVQWVRRYPPLRAAHWQVRQGRQQYDAGYEPVVAGGRVFVASSRNDSVTAIDLDTGRELWRFYADGPVRFAPAIRRERVYFGSDDGCLYCLAAADGRLVWKHAGSPSTRKVIGNGRMISVWPARGGPVVHGSRVYFTAGIWPFEGIFVWALDGDTGRTAWLNDRVSHGYIQHPHAAMSFGGPSPQGYLLVHDGELIVPNGRAFPAYFDLATGKLKEFEFGHGGHGSRPGGWFVAAGRDGQMHIDPEINRGVHDEGYQTIGQRQIRGRRGQVLDASVTIGTRTYRVTRGARRRVVLGSRTFDFAAGVDGVDGTIHALLAADGRLLVVTRDGGIYCLAARAGKPVVHEMARKMPPRPADGWARRAGEIIEATGVRKGYALVLGLGTGRLAEELVRQSRLHVIAVDTDAKKVDAFRRRADAAGVYGRWAAAFATVPRALKTPPYFASLVVCEDPSVARRLWSGRFAAAVVRSLRPYGGKACLPAGAKGIDGFEGKAPGFEGLSRSRCGEYVVIARPGRLPGSADYEGRPNYDTLVRGPFGVLWFGDTHHHHKLFSPDPASGFLGPIGSGLPTVVQGVIRYVTSEVPYGTKPENMKRKKVPRAVYSDLYTGRALSADELPPPASRSDTARPAPSPYPITRINPLTGVREARNVMKGYGCDARPVDYGHLYTMRSGTAAYYDKRTESGTVNISGLRSGCRNNIIPADGVLAVPYWLGNCTCNYPNFTSLALVARAESHEQWAAWGPVAVEAPLVRGGINLGAPGDRAVADGTLWIAFPNAGAPSPEVPIAVEPNSAACYYRHSGWVRGGPGWPWVLASGVEGLRSLSVTPVAKRPKPTRDTFSVRWVGKVRPDVAGAYRFHGSSDYGYRVWVGDELVSDNQKDRRRGKQEAVSRAVALAGGRSYDLVMEYYRRPPKGPRTPASAELAWSSESLAKCAIPAKNFRTIDGAPGGITGIYYHSENLKGPGVLRTDAQIRFDWGRRLPEPLRPPARPARPHARYTVRLYFAEPKDLKPGRRVFTVTLQGREVLKDFDVVSQAGGTLRGVVKEFKGIAVRDVLRVGFVPTSGEPILSGLELLAEPPARAQGAPRP